MRKIVDADRERREFEEDHMVRLVSACGVVLCWAAFVYCV